MNEIRAKNYFFWLTEYKIRRLIKYVGHNDARIYLTILSEAEWYKRAGVSRVANKATAQMLAEYIKQKNWGPELDHEDITGFYGNDIRDRFSKDRGCIDNIASYLFEYGDDLFYLLEAYRGKTSSEEIIKRHIEGTLHEKNEASFGAYSRHLKYRAPAFTAWWADDPISDGTVTFKRVEINLNADMKDILSDVAVEVCEARMEALLHDKPDRTDEELDQGCPGYGPCFGGKCEYIEGLGMVDTILRRAKQMGSGYAYTPCSDKARAIGLWLWDYVQENSCSVGEAARAVKKQDFFPRLLDDRTAERTLERWYARTNECIEQGQVLSMR